MAIIENAKYNSLPEQVEENKDNIKKLDDAIAEIDPEAITAVIDQVATNTSDISNIKGEQITQNNNIGLNALAITSEATNRKALIDVSAIGDTNVKAQAGKDINLYSSNKIQVYGDEGADVSDDYGDGVSVLKDTIILETTSHNLILNEDGTLKMDSNKIAENGHLTFENIYDSQGRPRFIEGAGTLPEMTGVTFTYNKWSLSGTHLMLVLAGEIANGTALPSLTNLDVYSLPLWVYNKIYPVWATTYIELKALVLRDNDWVSQSVNVTLTRVSSNRLAIQTAGAITLTATRKFRIQFDLLIDNE